MNELIADILEVLDPQDRTPFWKRLFRSERAFLASQYAIGNIHDEVQGTRYFERRPRVIYFYYLKFNQDGSLTAHEYRYFNKADPKTPDPGPEDDIDDKTDLFLPIEFKDLDGHILKLVENARGSQTKPAHYSVGNFQELLWKRRCYFVIFFDEDNWNLYRRPIDKDPPIIFLTKKKNGKPSLPNHTFYDGKFRDIKIPIPDEKFDNRSYFVFINYMKSSKTGELEIGYDDREQYFNFNILIEVHMKDQNRTPLLVIFDPGGTNMGPPLSP